MTLSSVLRERLGCLRSTQLQRLTVNHEEGTTSDLVDAGGLGI